MVLVYMYWQCKHTHNHLIALCPGLPRWAGTRRNLHPLTSMRQRRIRTDSKVHCLWAHPVYGASKSWWRLLDPIKPTYNPSRPDVRLKLTAGAFNQLWIWMPAVLVTIPTVTQNSLHPLLTSSISSCHLLDFMVQVKRTEADAPPICQYPYRYRPPFLCWMPFLPQLCQFILAWDRHRIMLACIPRGLVYWQRKQQQVNICIL